MPGKRRHSNRKLRTALAFALCVSVVMSGCARPLLAPPQAMPVPGAPGIPRELEPITLPPYTIAPPDILLIDALKVVPKAPFKIEALDVLAIAATGTLEDQPIQGEFTVEPGGSVSLGPGYGKVAVAGLTLEEAEAAVETHLHRTLNAPDVALTLAATAGQQQITGEHLVGPDGTIKLGTYGSVYVTGMTLDQAQVAVERHLTQFLEDPKVSVDVFAYNSKVYYIITEGAGLGDRVDRLPITGNETVLDAISQINGLSRLSSKKIWIARPAPGGMECDQILPVCWEDITKGAATATNYQVLPGDRIFIAEDHLVRLDTGISKLLSPFERIFGFTLLGVQTVGATRRLPDDQGRGF